MTAVHGSALGPFLSLSSRSWYAAYTEGAALWGRTGLENQQLGGPIIVDPVRSLHTLAALRCWSVG